MASSSAITLPTIARSPSTLQYRVLATRPKKFYKPAFVLDREDRAKTLSAPLLQQTDPMMPPYPYGGDVRYREANDGLYGGVSIQSGNKISKGRNKGKTLRKWFPNVKLEKITSEALGQELSIPITARVMRTIRKVGGLDQYLTGKKPARVKELGLLGWKLRWLVINSPSWKQKYTAQRLAAGVSSPSASSSLPDSASSPLAAPPSPPSQNPLDETFEQAWADPSKRQALTAQQTEKWTQLQQKDERFKRHFMQNILADRTALRVPDLKTLQYYDPEVLKLEEANVREEVVGRVNERGVPRRGRDPASDVS